MDVYCRFCEEPWDAMEVADFVLDYDGGTRSDFYDGVGCPSCHWGKDTEKKTDGTKAAVMGALREILGDDEDGIAAEMDDWEMMYGNDE